MALPEVIPIRSDEVKQKKTDIQSAFLTYIGRADFFALTSEPKWQILRKTTKDGVESIDYADWAIPHPGYQHKKGEYAFIWDDRATYFPVPDTGGAAPDSAADEEDGVVTPTIFHLSMPLANIEYSYAFPTNTKEFFIQTQGFILKYAYVATQSGTVFWTLKRNNYFHKWNIIAENLTIYVQSPSAGKTLEIQSWK